jgi:restriction system protein
MTIWRHDEFHEASQAYVSKCLYCRWSPTLTQRKGSSGVTGAICSSCGWWSVHVSTRSEAFIDETIGDERAAVGVLRNLDLTDLSLPMGELRKYLLANYDARFQVHPKRYEDLVGAIFASFGYTVRVTSFSGDDGIDVFVFDGDANDVVGIQVKRYQSRIEAEQIRAFAGAMVLNNLTRGIYVTTSTFQSGASTTATRYGSRGIGITLWDAEEFYDRLRLSSNSIKQTLGDDDTTFNRLINDPFQIPIRSQFAGYFDD